MKNFTKKIVFASLFATACFHFAACQPATEKTTTIIKEGGSVEKEPGVQFKIQTGGKGISVETSGH
jgi:hypothetical protein